ncbi:unnamed protein product [Blepharisma stoltei]|uniref:Uncharacterized protein n=1 Tax=Blepharisma stoltei TaxID=1481888 RepID=A0AAU9IPX1_9CILI|nr:unnamed protein product [Blepharisma stoltei]
MSNLEPIEEEIFQGNTAEEKLVNAKSIIESLEKELFKLRTDLKRSEATVQKLQDSAALQSQNHNNTSSAFSLPSEFKKIWEVMVLENILDVFSSFLSDHVTFTMLIQVLIKLVIDKVQSQINYKVNEIMNLLLIPSSEEEGVKKYLLKLFQDFSLKSFPVPSLLDIKKEYTEAVEGIEQVEDFEDMVDSPEFEKFVIIIHKLSLHMCLNDPPLSLNFSENLEYLVFDKPDEFYCIDGFPKNAPPCVIVVPPVMRNNYAYHGIKPAVLVLTKQDVEEAKKRPNFLKEKKVKKEENDIKVEELETEAIHHENNKEEKPPIEIKEEKNEKKKEIVSKFEIKPLKLPIKEEIKHHEKAEIAEDECLKISTGIKIAIDPTNATETKETLNSKDVESDQFSFSKEKTVKAERYSDEENQPPLSKSPGHIVKTSTRDTSPRQVMDLYCRYKTQSKERKTSSFDDDRSLCYLPLQKKSPIRVSNFIRPDSQRHYQSARVFEKNSSSMPKKHEICTQCKPKLPCTRCAKTSLLALSNRIPLSIYNQRNVTPVRAFSSSTLNSSGRFDKSKTQSLHTRKPSPNYNDRPQNGVSDKCKVM